MRLGNAYFIDYPFSRGLPNRHFSPFDLSNSFVSLNFSPLNLFLQLGGRRRFNWFVILEKRGEGGIDALWNNWSFPRTKLWEVRQFPSVTTITPRHATIRNETELREKSNFAKSKLWEQREIARVNYNDNCQVNGWKFFPAPVSGRRMSNTRCFISLAISQSTSAAARCRLRTLPSRRGLVVSQSQHMVMGSNNLQ